MWMEYVGSRVRSGIVEDFEHKKFYFGPENNWKCEIPDILAGMILEEKGTDQFRPCLAPVKVEEKPQDVVTKEEPVVKPKKKRGGNR